MYTYEFITPSDPITFNAENDKIAFICAFLLANGKAECKRMENDKEVIIPSMLLISETPNKDINDYLGMEMKTFIDANKRIIRACFESFAYTDIKGRIAYDNVYKALKNPSELKDFKERHEYNNRTSSSEWVKYAWTFSLNF
jgi:hypothetical protein